MAPFSGTPASLPQDYAIVAHFASDHENRRRIDEVLPDDSEDEQLSPSASVSSMTKDFFTSSIPEAAKFNSVDSGLQALTSETTPLLCLPKSRIEGNVDATSCDSNELVSMFWEEVKTLIKYSLPVFGLVFSVSPLQILLNASFAARTSLNTASSCRQ
jgi:MATE family multidrug resistance protein